MDHSFTDEQLLNLVNNTIKTKTEFELESFTGGSVQITSTNSHQLIKYRVSLFFGYKSKNPISRTIDINEELVTIWQSAIQLKVKAMQVSTNGMNYSELNALMNPPSSNKVEVVSNIVVSKGITTGSKVGSNTISQSELDSKIVAKYLYTTIQSFNPSFRGDYTKWVNDIEKAIRIDGRSKEQLIECINWIYASEKGNFWIPNIMSGKKLREKFDQLNMQCMNTKTNAVDSIYNNGATATDMIKEMERRSNEPETRIY